MAEPSLKELISRGLHLLPIHRPIGDNACSCGRSPCPAIGKHPRTRAGVHSKSNRWVDVVEWRQMYPDTNWAVACATPLPEGGYMAVLDVDPRNGGHDTLRGLQELHGPLPATLWANTGGGGQHYIFRTREPVASAILGPGLELKGVGSYIVVAPSRHQSGRDYVWAADIQTPVVDLPAWVPAIQADAKARPEHSHEDPASTFLGRVAEKMGWLGESIGNGKRALMCPWQHEHSNTAWHPRSSGTVLLPATADSNFGGFKCFHEHCARRTAGDVLLAASDEAKNYARSFHVLAEAAVTAPPAGATRLGQAELQGIWVGAQFVPSSITANAAAILAKDPEWAGVLAYDEMLATVVALKAPPFPTPWGALYPRAWQEPDDRHTLVWLQTGAYAAKWTARIVMEAIHTVSDANRFNRLTEELDNLVWDGVERINSWLVDYLGASTGNYTATVGAKWLIAAVARAKNPGCKVDHVLVLEGAQGLGKSKALSILGGKWFSDDLGDIAHGKDASERIRGKWIVEDSELASLRRSDTGMAKAFVTRQVDYFREAYAKRATEYPRRCVFAGTVNNPVYLRDSTGARRFWCVRVEKADVIALERDRSQLWAEAVYRFNVGETWWPESAEFETAAAEETEKRYIRDPFEDSLNLNQDVYENLGSLYLQLGIPNDRRTPEHERRLIEVLTRNGYRATLIEGKKAWKK